MTEKEPNAAQIYEESITDLPNTTSKSYKFINNIVIFHI